MKLIIFIKIVKKIKNISVKKINIFFLTLFKITLKYFFKWLTRKEWFDRVVI